MTKTMHSIRRASGAILAALAILAAPACNDFNVPNYGAQSITELQEGANAAQVGAAVVGLFGLSREFETSFLQSHTSVMGNFGREGMELDPSNPQHPTDRFDQVGTGEQGYVGWGVGYRVIKQGNVILKALSTATGLTDPQKEGVRGVTKTIQAIAFNRLINAFDASGIPIDVDIATSDAAAAIAPKAQVLTRIAQLLDEGSTHLGAAGTAFSFTLPPGFTTSTQGASFGTPVAFRTFNRGLRARIAAYQADYATTLTALTGSFITTAAGSSVRYGGYDTYSSRSGDRTNPLYDPTCRQLFALTSLETGAQFNGATIDTRWTTKVQKITAKTIHTYVVDACWRLYPSPETPIPILRNEELILLRAEARWFTGDKPGAIADLDYIRATSGGLGPASAATPTPVTIASPDAVFLDELLYNRLYSLMWEGGHRWVDARRFNRLGSLPKTLPRAAGNTSVTKVYPYLQLPTDECLPRGNPAANCTAPTAVP